MAALVLVTGDARQTPSVLMARTTMMAGGLEVTTIKEGSGETAAVPFVCRPWPCCVPCGELLRMVHPDERVLPLQTGDNVKVQYSGKLANGKVFDSGDISFPLGAGHVIKGVFFHLFFPGPVTCGCARCHPFAHVVPYLSTPSVCFV